MFKFKNKIKCQKMKENIFKQFNIITLLVINISPKFSI